jgi:hypothetical protein
MMKFMAWENYKPNRTDKRSKQPRATISSSGNTATLLINNVLGNELGLNRLAQHTRIRVDKERNCLGLTFHQKPNSNRVKLGSRLALDNTISRAVNVTQLMCDVRGTPLAKGTYHLDYAREGDILVLKLDSLDKSKD